jgi:hypothetical protein
MRRQGLAFLCILLTIVPVFLFPETLRKRLWEATRSARGEENSSRSLAKDPEIKIGLDFVRGQFFPEAQ